VATLAAFLIAPSGGGSRESDQAGFVQLAQQIPMVPGKYFESSALVGRNPRYLQNNCGKAGNSRLLRLRQLFQTSQVLLGNMGLLHKTADIVSFGYGPALALWQPLAVFADMNSVALAGKLLVWPLAPTDPAIVSHSSSFRFRVRIINRARWKKGLPRARPILPGNIFTSNRRAGSLLQGLSDYSLLWITGSD
jgi:hypothetical protein